MMNDGYKLMKQVLASDEWSFYEIKLANYADVLRAENEQLRAALAEAQAANARLAAELAKFRVVTTTRRCKEKDVSCDGDGGGPGWVDYDGAGHGWCGNDAKWEVEATDGDGINLTHLCDYHLNDYQRWAAEDGQLPMVFELE